MSVHQFFRACCVGVFGAWLCAITPAYADPITISAVLGVSTLAGAAISFVITTAISPGAFITGEMREGGLSSRPPRMDAITPIGGGGGSPSAGPFMIALTTGDCMAPTLRDMTYMLLDKRLSIRRGDLVTMKLSSGPMAGAVITKRFVEAYAGIVSVAQSSPPARLDFTEREIEWAYRVRAISPSLTRALWTMIVAIFRPRALNERLAMKDR